MSPHPDERLFLIPGHVMNLCLHHPLHSSFAERNCTGYTDYARFITTPSKKSHRNARFASRSRW
jgi:hypothetical protein